MCVSNIPRAIGSVLQLEALVCIHFTPPASSSCHTRTLTHPSTCFMTKDDSMAAIRWDKRYVAGALVATILVLYVCLSAFSRPSSSADPVINQVPEGDSAVIGSPVGKKKCPPCQEANKPDCGAGHYGHETLEATKCCPVTICCQSMQCSPGLMPKSMQDTEASVCPILSCEKIESAPPEFMATLVTSKGDLVFRCVTAWAPLGVQRVYEMIQNGFFNDNGNGGIGVFRNVKNFVAQFGIHGDPEVSKLWRKEVINDDPVTRTNAKGTLTFATAGKNTRTTQLFINHKDNSFLDSSGFAPLCELKEGLDVLSSLNNQYGEQPNQGSIQSQGNAYLKPSFPLLDYIIRAHVAPVSD